MIPHPYVALTIRPSSCCKAFSVDLPAIKHIVSLDRTQSGAGVLKGAIILKAHLMTSHFLKSFSTASSLPLLLSVEWRCLSGNSSWSGITGIVSFTAGGLRLSEMETYHIKSKPVVLVWILAAGDMTACSMHGQVPKETGRPTWQPDSASVHFSADIIAVTERLHAVWGTWHCKGRTPHSQTTEAFSRFISSSRTWFNCNFISIGYCTDGLVQTQPREVVFFRSVISRGTSRSCFSLTFEYCNCLSSGLLFPLLHTKVTIGSLSRIMRNRLVPKWMTLTFV